MGAIAYALRDQFAGTVEQVVEEGAEPVTVPAFSGGLIRLDADRELDVRAALDEHDGVIVVDDSDQSALVALDGYLPLKRTAVPEGAEPVAGDYASRTNAVLRDELERRGVQGAGNKNHDELVAALEGYDALNDAGALPAELTVKSIDEAAAGAEGGDA